MPYSPTTWADTPSTSSPESATNFNHLETQYTEAINSFEQDMFTPFVFGSTSFVATRDGTTLSQLDVTAGVAFLKQSDNTLRRRAPTSSTQSASGHPLTTLFLDLNPDGTWSWGTSHSGVSGHLTIASVTTDSSSNIVAVTDARTLSTSFLSATTPVAFGQVNIAASALGAGAAGQILYLSSVNAMVYNAPLTGASSQGHYFGVWTGSAGLALFSIGGQLNAAPAYVDLSGGVHDVNGRVAVEGAHSAGQPALSYGAGAPSSLASNEIYFQVS